jgi:uncharacterized protein YkwD
VSNDIETNANKATSSGDNSSSLQADVSSVPDKNRIEMLKSVSGAEIKSTGANLPKIQIVSFTAEDRMHLAEQRQKMQDLAVNNKPAEKLPAPPVSADKPVNQQQVNHFVDSFNKLLAKQEHKENKNLPPEGNTSKEKFARNIFIAINNWRKENGLRELKYSEKLTEGAEWNSEKCVENGELNHYQKNVFEVAGQGHGNAKAVLNEWLNSPEHKRILSNPSLKSMGTGVAGNFETARFATS